MLNATYWLQPDPGPLTVRAGVLYLAYAVILLGGIGWAGRAGGRLDPPGLDRFLLAAGLAGLLLLGARWAGWPGWSARIWPLLAASALVGGAGLAWWLPRAPAALDDLFALLSFQRVGPPLPLRWQATLWGLHLAGLGLWVQAIGWPPHWGLMLWGALLGGQWLVSRLAVMQASPALLWPRLRPLYVSPLAPLFAAYLSAVLHLWLAHADPPLPVPTYPPLSMVWLLLFDPISVGVAAGLYALLTNLFLLRHGLRPRSALSAGRLGPGSLFAAVVVVAVLAWMSAELCGHHTHGVTGTDPYGYAQVAVDLATRGTPLHRFDLFSHIVDLPLAWAPVIAQGYHLPINAAGDAASVWPPGASVLLALGYRLAGEAGLYLIGPLLALVATGVVGLLAMEIGRNIFPTDAAALAGGLALLVWSTSYEVIDRSLVPMADIPAALFTALAWVCLLRARWGSSRVALVNGLAAGLALGLAFDMRYTQFLLVASVIAAAWRPRWRPGLLLAAGVAALVAALPDVLYRWWVLGSPLANPQRRELIHFAAAHILPTLVKMGQALLHGREFGLILPFVLVGMVGHYRRDRHGFWLMTAGALAVAVLQLPYEALVLRDWLPLFPLPAAWAGLGMVQAWRWLAAAGTSSRVANLLAVGGVLVGLLLPVARVRPLVARTAVPHTASFGYVTSTQRAALARLQMLTPAPSAIGVELNGGAVALHSRRWPFYPARWSAAELNRFLARMAADGVPVYLLDDGPALRPVIDRLKAQGRLRPIARLDVPLSKGGGTGWLYRVE